MIYDVYVLFSVKSLTEDWMSHTCQITSLTHSTDNIWLYSLFTVRWTGLNCRLRTGVRCLNDLNLLDWFLYLLPRVDTAERSHVTVSVLSEHFTHGAGWSLTGQAVDIDLLLLMFFTHLLLLMLWLYVDKSGRDKQVQNHQIINLQTYYSYITTLKSRFCGRSSWLSLFRWTTDK